MIKTALGAQRYNNRMDKIFKAAMALQKECQNCKRLYYIKATNCPLCGTPGEK